MATSNAKYPSASSLTSPSCLTNSSKPSANSTEKICCAFLLLNFLSSTTATEMSRLKKLCASSVVPSIFVSTTTSCAIICLSTPRRFLICWLSNGIWMTPNRLGLRTVWSKVKFFGLKNCRKDSRGRCF